MNERKDPLFNGVQIKNKRFFLLFLFMILQSFYNLKVHSLNLYLTGKETGITLQGEYNRSFNYCGNLAITAAAELNSRLTIRGGLALGNMGNEIDLRAFTGGETALPVGIPLYLGLAYIYNGLPGYETHTHSLQPLIALNGRWAGIALGPGLRLTSFFGEPPLFESMLSFSGYVNFIKNETLRLGLRCGNFNSFNAGNMGSYSLSLNSRIRLTKQCTLINDLEILQTGSVALTANFYGIVYRGGLIVSW